MNEYKITYNTQGGVAQHTIIERSESAACKALKARANGVFITDIELVATDVNATKDQERETLEKIKAMVEELGPQSYLKTAFDGVFEDAERNIEDDAAYSMKARLETQAQRAIERGYEVDRLKVEIERLSMEINELTKKAEEQKATIAQLERRQLSEELRRDLWMLVTAEAEESRSRMAKSADMIVTCSDNPGCVGFVESVADYRKEKKRAEAMEKRAAGLDALEPKDK